MDVELSSDGSTTTDDTISLANWLRRERALQGRVRMVRRPTSDTELGNAFELISVAIGAGGLATVLAGSLSTWLQNRTKVRVRISRNGQVTEIGADNVQNATELIQQLMELPDEPNSQ
ncbi:effector-associated constant component EACC1 [Phytohabitans suffuscus]|uniref:Uncharacterized protein n=1 Tax=Phytohabitans suffuscus TaxID=624315 RepID=A0A6F8YKE3_9ACTN|nr:hypothetical protein [Phytohabitans suffuscus]BCB86582.1 hypothetical protein Psuf_038950 [Phytohabitans suffuscus]